LGHARTKSWFGQTDPHTPAVDVWRPDHSTSVTDFDPSPVTRYVVVRRSATLRAAAPHRGASQ